MDMAARMIERGEIDYALVVDGETADLAYEKTIERMLRPDSTEDEFRNELATLTLGSGAAGMVLARAELHPEAPRYRGGVTRSATEWNTLCRGNPVSYTHLDVYKRQGEGPAARRGDARVAAAAVRRWPSLRHSVDR